MDRLLFGRCTWQGDPVNYEPHLSLEDELVTRFTAKSLRSVAAI